MINNVYLSVSLRVESCKQWLAGVMEFNSERAKLKINSIAIGTYLEPELVNVISQALPNLSIVYEPEILPPPRYKCDHSAPARELTDKELNKWLVATSNVDAYFDFDWYKPSEMIKRNPNVKWIQATSAGIGSFMKRSGLDLEDITVTTAGGIHAIPLTEFALMGALHFIKSVPLLDRWKKDEHWQRYTTRQLAGKRILIVGLGGIGRKMAQTFSDLGMDVVGLGRTRTGSENPHINRLITADQLISVLPSVDLIVVCCPLTTETEGLIGKESFAVMKPETILINISRGQVVDEACMIEALGDGTLLGACLDVFTEEPLPKGNPLWQLPNVIISPHSASTVETENKALVDLFLENLALLESKKIPKNLYVPSRGY